MARSEKMVSISPERLRYAREYYGLEIEQVTQRLSGIKPDELKMYENGNDFPTYSRLESLANLYKRPLLFFFFKSQVQQERLAIAFRSLESEMGTHFDMQIRIMMEQANLHRMNVSELFSNRNYPKFSTMLEEDNISTEKKLAKWLRVKIGLSLEKQKSFNNPVEFLDYLREMLYDIGIYIFKDSFRVNEISGLCLYDEEFPIILLNNKTSFTRQIFTIFHEIYHLFCKKTNVSYSKISEEKACDRFSGEFLVPTDDLEKVLRGVTHYEDKALIEKIASEYNVSPATIAYRMKLKDKISAKFYSSVHEDGIRKMNSESSGGNFYYTRLSYLGKPYSKQVFTDYYAGKIGVTTVGRLTGLKVSHIPKLSTFMFGGELQ